MEYITVSRTRSGDVIHPQLRPLGLGPRLIKWVGWIALLGIIINQAGYEGKVAVFEKLGVTHNQ